MVLYLAWQAFTDMLYQLWALYLLHVDWIFMIDLVRGWCMLDDQSEHDIVSDVHAHTVFRCGIVGNVKLLAIRIQNIKYFIVWHLYIRQIKQVDSIQLVRKDRIHWIGLFLQSKDNASIPVLYM